MKKLFVYIFLFAWTITAHCQWIMQKSFPDKSYGKIINLSDSRHGWAASSPSYYYKYNGVDWTEQKLPIGSNEYLTSIVLTDSLNGWGIGGSYAGGTSGLYYSVILRYKQGNWSVFNRDTGFILNAIDCVDSNHCWAVGRGGIILKYNGTSWKLQVLGYGDELYNISMADTSLGFATFYGSYVFKYNGESWSKEQYDSNYSIEAIDFIDSTNAWAVGYGTIYIYKNQHWSVDTVFPNITFNNIKSINRTNAIAVGWHGEIVRYQDGHWVEFLPNPFKDNTSLFGICFPDSMHGWIIGYTGILHTDQGGYVGIKDDEKINSHNLSSYEKFNIYPNPAFDQISIVFNTLTYCKVKISFYDNFGRVVKNLSYGKVSSGLQSYNINITELPSGIYYCHFTTLKEDIIKKFVIFK